MLDFLLLKELSYSNNSIINIDCIGQDGDALFCIAKVNKCCRLQDNSPSGIRDWYDPKGIVIDNQLVNAVFQTRGPQSVILHNKNNSLTLRGLYKCKIYQMTIYVGLYHKSEGTIIII